MTRSRLFAIIVICALACVVVYSRLPLRFDGSSVEAFNASAEAIQESLTGGGDRGQFKSDMQDVMALVLTEDKELTSQALGAAFSSKGRDALGGELQSRVRELLDGKTLDEFRELAEQGRKNKKEKFGGLLAGMGEPRPSSTSPTVHVMWANEAELLAAAPNVELFPTEIEIRDTPYLIDLPEGATFDDEGIRPRIKLATGEHADVFSRDWNIPRLRRLNGEFIYKGRDSIVFTNDTIYIEKQNEQKGHGDHPYKIDFNVVINEYRVIGVDVGHALKDRLDDSPVNLEAGLLLIRCMKSLRLKRPDPKEPVKLLAALGVQFSPQAAAAPEDVKGIVFPREATACDIRVLNLFPNVESVTIPGTRLGGTYDEVEPLRSCRNLKRFVLEGSITRHNIDTVLAHTGLEELTIDFDGSKSDKSWFQRLRKLKDLRKLTIEVDDEKVALLSVLADCRQLESLSITTGSAYEPMQESLAFLAQLPKLTELAVDGNFSERLFQTLGKQKALSSLELELDEISGAALKYLGASRSLRRLSLDVDKAGLDSSAFQALAEVPLEKIKLQSRPWNEDDPAIDDSNIASLAAVKSLKFIELNVKRVSPDGLKFLGSLPALEKVIVNTSDALSAEDIKKLDANNPKLEIR